VIVSAILLATVALVQAPVDSTGAALYQAWCAKCHGADGGGVPARQTRLSVRPANLAECKASTAETEEHWTHIVRDGGAAFGLSLDMPAYGEAATPEQLRAVVRYVRSLCREGGWPPGELNFPRAFLAEKAFPEDEVVVTEHGSGQEYIYERRIGRRAQLEASARTVLDSADEPFDGVTAALKYNVWHSAPRRAIASVGLEATPPVGRQEVWELEPFFAFGANPSPALFIQGEFLGAWEDGEGVTGFSYNLGVGREVGRFVPMMEVGGTVPQDGESTTSLVPQVWFRLSHLGHVAGPLGIELPVQGPEPRHARLTAFVLWDFGDAGLFKGW
jgi:mono/diheme cytochrome c family protein